MISIIDGDSIGFMLGWVHKEHQNIDEMHQSIDTFLENMFILTGSDMYYGALAGNERSFRHDTYKAKSYKGNRSEIQEHMVFWRPIVAGYLRGKWNFDCQSGLEADDLVNTAALSAKSQGQEFTVCGVDKDLKQIPGIHFNYRSNEFCIVDEHQAQYNFFRMMLEGDTVDNILGVPGLGPVKAEKYLKPLLESQAERTSYEELVKSLYLKHFGPYYGEIIYTETEKTISLVWDRERKIEIHSVPQKEHPFETLNQST